LYPNREFQAVSRSVFSVTDPQRIKALQLSNAELRAALILAGKELKKRTIGRRDNELLQLFRRVLREARATAKAVK
jgi:hypothetical protein